jgi:hypothetical protein
MKKLIIMILAIGLLLAACSAPTGTTGQVSASVSPTETEASATPSAPETATPEPTLPPGVEKTSILLLGSMDQDFSEEGSDYALTHILVTLDPESRVIKFTTFPYNLLVTNGEEQDQLQQMCKAVGEDGTVAVLEENFGIEIDYWVHMNMDAVIGIVDLLSGITIESRGEEPLSGEETAEYFEDTIPKDQNNRVAEEEQTFREHHAAIIRGVIFCVKALGLGSDDLVSIALDVQDHYATNIAEEAWDGIAATAIYCIENGPQFLHVPETVAASEQDKWGMVFTEADAAAVRKFVGD